MLSMNLTELAAQYGGTLVNPGIGFSTVSIDSRSIKSGDLFVAIEGNNFDGHMFLNNLKSDIVNENTQDPHKLVSDERSVTFGYWDRLPYSKYLMKRYFLLKTS